MKNITSNIPGLESNNAFDYAAREALKENGWRKYNSNAETSVRADGLEFVMFAHYHRSKEGYRGKHPFFEVFASHWIVANGNRYDTKVIEILKERYGPVIGEQMIAPHASYWEKNWKNGTYYKYVYQHK